MNSLKIKRAFEKAQIPNMPMVRRHILENLEKVGADLDKLTSTELGYIIKALDVGYKDAKGRQEADYMADMGAVWIGGDVQKLIPIDALKAIEIKKGKETFMGDTTKHYPDGRTEMIKTEQTIDFNHYKLDYKEKY